MSWDAELLDDEGDCLYEVNYTHNTNRMIHEALGGSLVDHPWYASLDGASGPDGAAYLHRIISSLEADPIRFESMNPSNGWGSYESLLKVLKGMRDSVPERRCVWRVSG